MCQVAAYVVGIMFILALYDVWCFYGKHFLQRVKRSPELSLPEGLQITGGIDQFHVHGHRRECYPRYSPNFIPGAGVQLGDLIETLWPPVNKIADSTRGMASSPRQEFMDDIMNDSNWTKLTRIGM